MIVEDSRGQDWTGGDNNSVRDAGSHPGTHKNAKKGKLVKWDTLIC